MNVSAEQIARAMEEHGSIRRAAVALGVSEHAVRGAINASASLAADVNVAKQSYKEREKVATFEDRAPIYDETRLRSVATDAELKQLRRDVADAEKALAKRGEFLAAMKEAAQLPVSVPSYSANTLERSNLPERSIVLPIYDLQYGQFVRPEDVPFQKGGYTEAVFDARLQAYVEKVSRFLVDRVATTNFTELHLVLGGDLVEGYDIFGGQAWQLQKHPIRQTLDLRAKLGAALRELIRVAKEDLGVETIGLYAVPGNHGKVGGKRAGATPSDFSWDYLTAELIGDELRAEPVDLIVNEASGALMFETQGHTFMAIHGDEIKGHAGIPFYGFTRFDGRAMRLAETVYDYCLSGHIHQPATIPNGSGGEFIISGDWVGGNNLSKWIVAASRPQQRVLLVGRKYGVATDERIYLDGDRSKRKRPKVYKAGR